VRGGSPAPPAAGDDQVGAPVGGIGGASGLALGAPVGDPGQRGALGDQGDGEGSWRSSVIGGDGTDVLRKRP
jgi:hypothetical protein